MANHVSQCMAKAYACRTYGGGRAANAVRGGATKRRRRKGKEKGRKGNEKVRKKREEERGGREEKEKGKGRSVAQ